MKAHHRATDGGAGLRLHVPASAVVSVAEDVQLVNWCCDRPLEQLSVWYSVPPADTKGCSAGCA